MMTCNVVAATDRVTPVVPPPQGGTTITATDTGGLSVADAINFTIIADPGTNPPDPGNDRADDVGIYLIWAQWNGPEIDMAIVKGNQIRSAITAYVQQGDYDGPFSATSDWQLEQYWTSNTGTPQGDKRGSLQINSKKDTNWKKHVWSASDAKGRGAQKSENPEEPNDWVGAFWTADGYAVSTGIWDMNTEYFDNLTTDRQGRIIGIRVASSFIGVEGDNPGLTLSNTNLYDRGLLADPLRPPSFNSTQKKNAYNNMANHVLASTFPNGENNPAVYPVFFRATWITSRVDTSIANRIVSLVDQGELGLFVTSSEAEPSNKAHEDSFNVIKAACKKQGGNVRCYSEGFGRFPGNSKIQGNYSIIQDVYWRILHDLDAGISYMAIRDEYVGQHSVNAEMTASLDFCVKYVGYQQFPFRSPGAWVALREGVRQPGNYDFLAQQIVSADAARGIEYSAGSILLGPQTGFVGPPSSNSNNNNITGEGQRQSLWAMNFVSGEKLKVKLDDNFASTLTGQSVTVRVWYLNDSSNANLAVRAFEQDIGNINVGSTNMWVVAQFVIPSVALATDTDGAHITVTVSGAAARLHMIEVEKN